MAGFLYFLPNVHDFRAVAPGLLHEFGLDHLLDAGGMPQLDYRGLTRGGPSGAASGGILLAVRGTVPAVAYEAAPQTWRKVPGSEAWCGYITADPPQPENLARPRMIAGHPVRMANGQTFIAPKARSHAEAEGQLDVRPTLPWKTEVTDDGEWASRLPAELEPLWRVSCDVAAAICRTQEATDGGMKFDFAAVNDTALLALATNYRIGKAEVGLLQLFDERSCADVLMALVDYPGLVEIIQKKTVAGG